jgi:hypothetical protein
MFMMYVCFTLFGVHSLIHVSLIHSEFMRSNELIHTQGADADANIESGWRNYGGGYQNLRVGRWRRFVFVTGLLAGEGGHIATLPQKYRPRGGRLIFNLIKGDLDSRVDVS